MEVGKIGSKISLNTSDFTKGASQVASGFGKMGASVISFNQGLQLAKQVYSGFLKVLNKGQEFVDSAAKIERYHRNITLATGSTAKAAEVIAKIREASKTSDDALDGLMTTAVKFSRVLGNDVDKIDAWVRGVNALSSGTGIAIEELTGMLERGMIRGASGLRGGARGVILGLLGLPLDADVSGAELKKYLSEVFEKGTPELNQIELMATNSWEGMTTAMKNLWEDFKLSVMDSGLFMYLKALVLTINRYARENGEQIKEIARKISDFVIALIKGTILTLARVYDIAAPLLKLIGGFLSNAWETFNRLPDWMKELGLIGAIMFGKKGFLLLAGLSAAGKYFGDFAEGTARKQIAFEAYKSGKITDDELDAIGVPSRGSRLPWKSKKRIQDDFHGMGGLDFDTKKLDALLIKKGLLAPESTGSTGDKGGLTGLAGKFIDDIDKQKAELEKLVGDLAKNTFDAKGWQLVDEQVSKAQDVMTKALADAKFAQEQIQLEAEGFFQKFLGQSGQSDADKQKLINQRVYEGLWTTGLVNEKTGKVDELTKQSALYSEIIQKQTELANVEWQNAQIEANKALMASIENMINPFNLLQEALGRFGTVLGNTLQEFAETGKINLGELVSNLAKELTAMAAQKTAALLMEATYQSVMGIVYMASEQWTKSSLAFNAAAAAAQGAAIMGSFVMGAGLSKMAHSGMDYIPEEGTWLLDKGERVVDSKTNQDLKQFLKSGGGATNNITVNINGGDEQGVMKALPQLKQVILETIGSDIANNGRTLQVIKQYSR